MPDHPLEDSGSELPAEEYLRDFAETVDGVPRYSPPPRTPRPPRTPPPDTAPRGNRPPRYLLDQVIEEIRSTDFRATPSDDPTRMGEVITKATSVARRLVGIVLNGRDRDSIEAAKLIFSYVEGLPVQPVEFDIARVVTQIAESRGLTEEDRNRAITETRRVLSAAKQASG